MKTSHTKGPWNVSCSQKNNNFIVIGGRYIAEIYNHSTVGSSYKNENLTLHLEAEANARLIAAAPDMLEALERVIKWHETGCDISKKTLLNIQAIIDKVKT